MAQVTEDSVRAALATVKYPGFNRDIVSFGLVKNISIEGGDVVVDISIATKDADIPRQIHSAGMAAVSAVPGVDQVRLDFDIQNPPAQGGGQDANVQTGIPGIGKIIAVASGKGGVGKSTVSANLAVSLQKAGARVGLCDCDLYGPSVALMFGSDERPMATAENEIIPIEKYGLKLMSMGFLLEDSSPAIVRGPMAHRYTQQFLRNVAWGELDYLILDLPPGTGDIQLTIVQTVALAGVVVVTTPQEVALIDARKAASMFSKVNVPVLGVIENMSYFICPNDGNKYAIFGEGGGAAEAERLGVPLLGQIPLDIATREGGDAGAPVALKSSEENPVSAAFHQIADEVTKVVPAKG